MEIVISDMPAVAAADRIAFRLRDAVRRRGRASLALSGGSTAPPMITALAAMDLPWSSIGVWQVDERVAPDGDPDRNARQLAPLGAAGCDVHPMPVTAGDLRAAARRYAARLPAQFDVIHLGIGSDGHTASWPPDEPEIPSSPRPVELVERFNGRPRMTLTRRVVNGARARVVLAVGAAKRPVVERWLLEDPSLPITAVRRSSTHTFLDPAAAPAVTLH
jgi:6-phosphogluconolactonase